MTRRTAISTATGAIAAPAFGQGALAPPVPPAPATFVLVHGAWHGGWCWRDVKRLLLAEGHRVFTPTMTGLGERSHLGRADTGLSVHIEDIAAVLRSEELEGVIVVAHSYAGLPCSYVAGAMPGKVHRLVYLDSLLPTPGRSVFQDMPAQPRAALEKTLLDGFRLPSFRAEMFDVPKTHPNFEWLARRLTAMPMAPFTDMQPPLPPGFAGVAKTYVRCTGNSLDGPRAGAAKAAENGWQVIDLDSGHDAMITAPGETAALLERLAG